MCHFKKFCYLLLGVFGSTCHCRVVLCYYRDVWWFIYLCHLRTKVWHERQVFAMKAIMFRREANMRNKRRICAVKDSFVSLKAIIFVEGECVWLEANMCRWRGLFVVEGEYVLWHADMCHSRLYALEAIVCLGRQTCTVWVGLGCERVNSFVVKS